MWDRTFPTPSICASQSHRTQAPAIRVLHPPYCPSQNLGHTGRGLWCHIRAQLGHEANTDPGTPDTSDGWTPQQRTSDFWDLRQRTSDFLESQDVLFPNVSKINSSGDLSVTMAIPRTHAPHQPLKQLWKPQLQRPKASAGLSLPSRNPSEGSSPGTMVM